MPWPQAGRFGRNPIKERGPLLTCGLVDEQRRPTKKEIVMKKGISFEDHVKCGEIVKRIRCDVFELINLMSGGYALNSRLSKRLWRMRNDIDFVKSEAENAMFREHPTQANINIYYGE